MDIFDIIGPVMIGPSSSHTAGAVRLGRVVNKILDGRKPEKITITFSGSFARTYKGHGTDRALLAGILGYHSWDERIRDALDIAREQALDYEFVARDLPNAHPY
ncbi:MAG: L-serine ammonia-lyase, iron-sulfur-dependent, subunit beta, partial [Synergistaceae bacterium]|nr:L-serine ammonia-lyase, iron-sulfur-dependent, subunit beta [Synergistaceae bacterium]